MSTPSSSSSSPSSTSSSSSSPSQQQHRQPPPPPPNPFASPTIKPTKRINPALRFGVPLILFCAIGYGVLSQLVENRVRVKDVQQSKKSERAVHLEMAHKAVVGRLGLHDDYEIRPIPRPKDEEDSEADKKAQIAKLR